MIFGWICVLCMLAVEPSCPDGLVMSGGISTTSFIYELGCRTPTDKARGDLAFAENLCGEMGLYMGAGSASHVRVSEWRDGRCHQEDIYKIHRRVKRRPAMVRVSEEAYARATCMMSSSYDGSVWRTIYPKTEWIECHPKEKK